MTRINKTLPLTLMLFLPLWHSCHELNGSLSLLFNLMLYKGAYVFIKEIFFFPIKTICIAIIFHFFIKYVAPKFSIAFTSLILLISYYLFFSSSFFYDNLGIFFLIAAFRFTKQKQTEHLFFSLFYITLLHSFSSFLICIQFYGYNTSLFFIAIAPMICLYSLISKSTYPSKITLISLFPLTLFPVSYFVHNPIPLSLSLLSGGLLLMFSIYILLEKKNYLLLLTCLSLSLLNLLFMEKALVFPFIFLPIALLIGIMQIFYASKYHLSSHTPVLPHPMQPFSPSLRFYNEHMHY